MSVKKYLTICSYFLFYLEGYNNLALDNNILFSTIDWAQFIPYIEYKKATPLEWADYSSARELLRIFNSGLPTRMFDRLSSQSYLVKRPTRVCFFDKSRSRIAAQCFANWAAALSRKILFDWHFSPMSPDHIQIWLK